MEPVQLHHGAVGAAAGIGERQIQEDRTGRERQIGILEGGVVHLGIQREGREGAVAILALDPAVHGKVARRLHLVEVAGVDRRHQRQNAAEVGAGCLECQVETEQLADGAGRSVDPELEIVEAELGVLEDVGFLSQVGPGIGGEAELHPVEIGNPGKGDARGVGVEPSLDIDLGPAEVAAEGLIVALERGLEPGSAVVEGDVGVFDLEAAQTQVHRLPAGVWRLATVLGDVPVRGPVLQRDQRQPRLIQLDPADHDRPARDDIAEHAGDAEHHAEVADRGQGVALEAAGVGDGEIVEPEGEVGKVPEEAEPGVAPVDSCGEAAIQLQLNPRSDPVLEQHRQDQEQHEQESQQAAEGGQEAGAFHARKVRR